MQPERGAIAGQVLIYGGTGGIGAATARALRERGYRAPIAAMHALQRLSQPQDIARAASFLVSDEASWSHRAVLGVDGGRSTLRTTG